MGQELRDLILSIENKEMSVDEFGVWEHANKIVIINALSYVDDNHGNSMFEGIDVEKAKNKVGKSSHQMSIPEYKALFDKFEVDYELKSNNKSESDIGSKSFYFEKIKKYGGNTLLAWISVHRVYWSVIQNS